MSVFEHILNFIEGFRSVVNVSGVIQSTISDAISDGIERAFISDALTEGIERAFKRIRKPLEQSLMRISLTFVSILFIVWGVALFIDNFIPYKGLGFVIVGALFGILVLFFLQEKEEG